MSFPVQTLAQLRPILVGFRKSAGLTQAQLAARLGVTQQSYAQLEANPSAVSIERLFKVLNVLGVRLSLDPAASADVAQTAAGSARTRANSRRDSAPADIAARVAPSTRPARRRSSSAPAATGTAAPAAKTPVGAAGKRTPATPRKRRVAKREDW
ncbi:helix-turn-helix domain-containing protein [Burkholderia multivorans]|uniref:helix-turn-helix transcriptional regulator n=1 Tax=Burkholderia multivorans TaxID=87883 RepID=UPI001C23BE74|nr:helix-turn-helix transcriptional regulator [Burkholderia multivorans]MBU9441791.1 helix-turn-helix domain-containing protein [Burkholderia multivorans]MBU9610220.1 helix-turn-helix domain-containing protein [Burkholderia multivorans]